MTVMHDLDWNREALRVGIQSAMNILSAWQFI